VSSPMIGLVVALCSPPFGSTSGESVKEWSFAHPFLTATIIALLSLPFVLLGFSVRLRLVGGSEVRITHPVPLVPPVLASLMSYPWAER